MPRPFNRLRERLLRAGVAPRHVRRYLAELSDHLADLQAEEQRAGLDPAAAESAALSRLGSVDDLARAMTEQRQFQSWCARAPWAFFGFAPLFTLAAAWSVALFILWTGWQFFLHGSPTPFVRTHGGLPEIYFGVGRMIYFWSPVLIGWAVAFVAARQRLKPVWPALGLAPVALAGAAARVHASRAALSGGAAHVSMSFSLGSSFPEISPGLLRALFTLAVAALPYLIWRLQRVLSRSAG